MKYPAGRFASGASLKKQAFSQGVLARALLASAALLVAMSPAWAQSTKDRVRTLESQVAELEAARTSLVAAAQRIDRLEEEVRTLTGRVEELNYKLERADAQIASMSALLAGETPGGDFADLGTASDGRFGETAGSDGGFDGRGATSGPVDLTGNGAPSAAPAAIELPFDPQAAFEYADAFLLSSDYASASAAFSLFVESFPDHPRAADAQFRIGEIALATGDNPAAADAFIKHIQTYPNDPRAAEAYVKLGSAFARMGEVGEACKVLGAMNAKFSNISTELRARADRERSRAECQ